MRIRSRAGFTLIELVVALLVVGLTMTLISQVFAVVSGGARAIEASRDALDRRTNARRWMESVWLSLDVGDSSGGFQGHESQVEFGTWEMMPGGWFELAHVHIGVVDSQLVARTGGRSLLLSDGVGSVTFDYLLTPGADSRWVSNWVSPVSAPLAVRLRVLRAACCRQCVDTLLFLIGPRG